MIPFTLTIASPNGAYTDCPNININHESIKNKDKIDTTFTYMIAEFMYEFCSQKYGHGITIDSYSDFCDKWWTYQEGTMRVPVLEIRYFDDNDWNIWNISDHADQIFEEYEILVEESK